MAETEPAVGGTMKSPIDSVPQHILEDVLNRLEDARLLAIAEVVSKVFLGACQEVRTIRFVCSCEYHDSSRAEGETSISGSSQVLGNERKYTAPPFKDLITGTLKTKRSLAQLKIGVDAKLQSKIVSEEVKRGSDLWLSDPYFLGKWTPNVSRTLEHLCIVDYEPQARTRRSNILTILSNTCFVLKTLDLRHMFIDTEGFGDMPSMTSFTLQSVRLCGSALQDISNHMPKLQNLALKKYEVVMGGR